MTNNKSQLDEKMFKKFFFKHITMTWISTVNETNVLSKKIEWN